MPRRSKYALRKREWLNPFPSEYDSYISVLIESSHDGEDATGTNVIHIGDCYRRIELHFDLCNARDRRESLWKIDELLDVIATFRTALYKESRLIEKKQAADKN